MDISYVTWGFICGFGHKIAKSNNKIQRNVKKRKKKGRNVSKTNKKYGEKERISITTENYKSIQQSIQQRCPSLTLFSLSSQLNHQLLTYKEKIICHWILFK